MVEETFPASDATQLPGRADGAPHSSGSGGETEHDASSRGARKPRTIGNQGVVPATRMLEETVHVTETATLTLRVDAERRRLLLRFNEESTTLDAAALDRLIEVLSAKRALLMD
jgi:hypothetical protein